MKIIQNIVANQQLRKQVAIAKKPFTEAGLRFHKLGRNMDNDVMTELIDKKGFSVVTLPNIRMTPFEKIIGFGNNKFNAILNLIEKTKGRTFIHCGDVYSVGKDAKKVERSICHW